MATPFRVERARLDDVPALVELYQPMFMSFAVRDDAGIVGEGFRWFLKDLMERYIRSNSSHQQCKQYVVRDEDGMLC